MIACNQTGGVIVSIGDKSYGLSASKQYGDFLLWVTSPYPTVVIDENLFAVDDSVPESEKAKASRYAEFLIEFCREKDLPN